MTIKNTICTLAIFASLGVLNACSAKLESVGEPIDFTLKDQTPPPAPTAKLALEGKWRLNCLALSSSSALTLEAEYLGDTFSNVARVYSDLACTRLASEDFAKGTFSIPGTGLLNSKSNDGTVLFDIFSIEDGVLYFGAEAGETEATRPTALNKRLGLKKIQ